VIVLAQSLVAGKDGRVAQRPIQHGEVAPTGRQVIECLPRGARGGDHPAALGERGLELTPFPIISMHEEHVKGQCHDILSLGPPGFSG